MMGRFFTLVDRLPPGMPANWTGIQYPYVVSGWPKTAKRYRLRTSTKQSKKLSKCPSRNPACQGFHARPDETVVRALERAGFVVAWVRGSHYILILRHPERSGIRITVPAHTRDLKPKTLATIIKQARIAVDAFRALP